MADVARQPRPDLNGQATDPLATGFFELLRRLETETQRFGRSGGPADEPARLGQRVRLAVATREIAGFRPGDDLHPTEIDVEVLGLLGPEGAMPLHMTRWVMERLSENAFDKGMESVSRGDYLEALVYFEASIDLTRGSRGTRNAGGSGSGSSRQNGWSVRAAISIGSRTSGMG